LFSKVQNIRLHGDACINNLKEKRNSVIEWIKAQKSLITFLQETHFDVNIENGLNHKSDYDVFCSHGTTASRGVAIFMKKSLHFSNFYNLVHKYKPE
jgi:exonuclease III